LIIGTEKKASQGLDEKSIGDSKWTQTFYLREESEKILDLRKRRKYYKIESIECRGRPPKTSNNNI
jgi:hypothetical protein